MKEKEQYRREELEKLSSQQLDDVLCAELGKECPDRNVVLGILEILESREKDMPLPEYPVASEARIRYEAWNDGFNKGREASRKSMRKLAGVAIAAVLVLVFGVITPQALGAENIFTLIGRWTAAFFAFDEPETMPERAVSQPPYVFRTDNPGLQELYDTVTELGITQRVVPQWLPDGYELIDLKVDRTQKRAKIYACFANGSQEIIISIRGLLNSFSPSYFKDETDVVIYECGGVLHYIMGNENIRNVAWHSDNVECQIHVLKEDIYQIIESVYN